MPSARLLACTLLVYLLTMHCRCQWQTIWSDDMEQLGVWTISSSYTQFGVTDTGCFTGKCLLTDSGYGDDENAWRSTSISGYSSIRLKFDLSLENCESGDRGAIRYSYTSSSSSTEITSISAPNDGYHYYQNRIVTLPTPTTSTVWVWLYCDTGDTSNSDKCYWDNVSLEGYIQATPQPTPNPTKRPTNPVGTSTCGDVIVGSFHGSPVTFLVRLPSQGDLQFSAGASSFVVTDIEAYTKLGVPISSDRDEQLTLSSVPAGTYKFIINGDGTASGTFHATIACFYNDDTYNPTKRPTPNPTGKPTSGGNVPTPLPVSPNPTKRPTPK
eukprot:826631_1